jgi:hypothetical protein
MPQIVVLRDPGIVQTLIARIARGLVRAPALGPEVKHAMQVI